MKLKRVKDTNLWWLKLCPRNYLKSWKIKRLPAVGRSQERSILELVTLHLLLDVMLEIFRAMNSSKSFLIPLLRAIMLDIKLTAVWSISLTWTVVKLKLSSKNKHLTKLSQPELESQEILVSSLLTQLVQNKLDSKLQISWKRWLAILQVI